MNTIMEAILLFYIVFTSYCISVILSVKVRFLWKVEENEFCVRCILRKIYFPIDTMMCSVHASFYSRFSIQIYGLVWQCAGDSSSNFLYILCMMRDFSRKHNKRVLEAFLPIHHTKCLENILFLFCFGLFSCSSGFSFVFFSCFFVSSTFLGSFAE